MNINFINTFNYHIGNVNAFYVCNITRPSSLCESQTTGATAIKHLFTVILANALCDLSGSMVSQDGVYFISVIDLRWVNNQLGFEVPHTVIISPPYNNIFTPSAVSQDMELCEPQGL